MIKLSKLLNEDGYAGLVSDIPGAKIYNAHGGGNAEVQSTKKTWDDDSPVLKYIARSPKKTIKLPKKFKIVDDTKYGWWYFKVGSTWYGIDKDKYGTPPFEY